MNARARRSMRKRHVRRAFDYFRRVHGLPARAALELARAEVWAYYAGAVGYVDESHTDCPVVTGFEAFPSGELRGPEFYISLHDPDGDGPAPVIEGHTRRYWVAEALADRRARVHPRRMRRAS